MKPEPESTAPLIRPTAEETAARISDQVKGARLQLLYYQSYPAVFISLATAGLLAAVVWPVADRSDLIVWLVILGLASFARLGLFLGYYYARPTGDDILTWQRPYLMTLVVSSLIWGLGSVWIMPRDQLVYQAITYFFLMGMAGGALSLYAAIRLLALSTITLVLIPMTLWMFTTGDLVPSLLGAGGALFFVSAIRATKVLSTALQQNLELQFALKGAKEAAEQMASTDGLTGINNRRAFMEQASGALVFCKRHHLPASVLMMDLDHFKKVNDTRGHAAGDAALQHVSRVVQATVRRSDICGRLGGEEFAVLLLDTSIESAKAVAEKIRLAVEEDPVRLMEGDLSLTLSIGVSEGTDDLKALLDQADAAMYRAKNEGRNRVRTYQG